jgi:tetratricopeptide (TPR) repeat protein
MREINRQLLVIRGKFQEGYSAYRARNVEQAEKHWRMVLEAEQALLPEGVNSFYAKEIGRYLGDLYFEVGEEEFKEGHLRQAYSAWSQGKRYNRGHERILNGLLELEKEAERLLREAKAAVDPAEAQTKLETARDISEPGGRIHDAAEELLQGS